MNAKVGTSPDGHSTVVTLELPRAEAYKIMDRWTWDEMKVVFSSGKEKFEVTFPKLQESKHEQLVR